MKPALLLTLLRRGGRRVPILLKELPIAVFLGLEVSWTKFRGQKFRGQSGVDPKFETLRNRDTCSERRFGWQQPVFSKWSSALR
jgi:hypothetical protein